MIFRLVASALTYYYQSVIFIPADVIWILNASVQVLNIFNNPAMGIIIYKTRTRFGKCRPYLLIMPIFIGLATVGLFVNGIYSDQNGSAQNIGIIATAASTYVLWSILYTAGDVPLTTLPSVMTSDANKKAKLISFSFVAAILGGGAVSLFFIPFAQSLSGILEPLGQDKARSAQYGFITAVVVFTLVAASLYQLAGIFTRERLSASDASPRLKNSLSLIKKNRAYRLLLLSGILRSPADTATVTLTMIIVYYYGNNGNTPYIVYMLAFFCRWARGRWRRPCLRRR